MKKLLALSICVVCAGWVIGCGGKQSPPAKDPDQEIQQLIKLYNEARPKFVVQKQIMIQDEDCSGATRLREAMDKIADEAAMSTEPAETIIKMQMEMKQAEKDCLAKQ